MNCNIKKSFIIGVTLMFIGVANFLFAQSKVVMIGDSVAAYYPESFDTSQTLPSLALLNEPKEFSAAPESWKKKVSFYFADKKNIAKIKIDQHTNVYGSGEVTGSLDRNGTVRKLWNTDNYGYVVDHALRLYQSHPWVLCVREDGTSFGVLADNTYRQELSVGDDIQFISDGPAFRVIVIERQTPQKVLQALADLTGKIELPPLWSIGFQQCRFSYYPDSRVKEIADTFRLKKIPCDVIWMDIHYMNDYRIFTFSPKYFPRPKEVNDYLHANGFKSIWMIDPGVKVEKGYSIYDSGTEQDVWVKNNKGETYLGKVWPGDCVFPDFTQPKTVKWWGGLYKDFMATGVDGVWNDMNEPAIFDGPGGTMPLSNIHAGGDGLPSSTHARYHNVYGRLMVEASRKGILNANPDKRPFVLTRSNFIGGQRFAATWTGDNRAEWAHLKMSIPMSLNLGLSGQPFSGSDIGGFQKKCSAELYGQWIALGVFYPFSRAHTDKWNSSQEPWSFGQKIEEVARTAISRRYRLLPYLYTLFYESSKNGMPVMRPLFFADFKDKKLREEDQVFMLGNDLIIVPKWAKNIKMPKGNWKSISLVGEDSKNDAYQPDIQLREGAILPLSNVFQSTANYSLDTLTLLINLDTLGKASGELYYDKGEGFDYKNGDFAIIKFKAETKNNKVIITIIKAEGNRILKNNLIIANIITDKGILKAHGKENIPIEIINP